ncbi:MAG TPA: methyltransferase domain-containing protein, partial [Chthonomonadaceae bacterium]|nr:methyltransferase domain-containing protein [Chthonomonadaceae bacterium]
IGLLRCLCGAREALRVEREATEGERIVRGALACPACGQRYPIEQGIARMLPPGLETEAREAGSERLDPEEAAHKRREMAARDAQVAHYDRMPGLALFGTLEIPLTLAQMSLIPKDRLLEVGCGTGRMTPIFAARCREMVAVDYSWESLCVCRRKLEAAGARNVDLIQADACALPFRDGLFTKVVSCQVLEHIPTAASRARMVAELARVAQAGGGVVLSAYQHSWFTRLFGQKEGAHRGGIYFYRFSRRELYALLAPTLEVQRMTGALVYHYLARCRKPFTDVKA